MTRLATRRHSQHTSSATQSDGAGPSDQHNNTDAQDASQVNSTGSGQPHSGDASHAGSSTMTPIAATLSGYGPLSLDSTIEIIKSAFKTNFVNFVDERHVKNIFTDDFGKQSVKDTARNHVQLGPKALTMVKELYYNYNKESLPNHDNINDRPLKESQTFEICNKIQTDNNRKFVVKDNNVHTRTNNETKNYRKFKKNNRKLCGRYGKTVNLNRNNSNIGGKHPNQKATDTAATFGTNASKSSPYAKEAGVTSGDYSTGKACVTSSNNPAKEACVTSSNNSSKEACVTSSNYSSKEAGVTSSNNSTKEADVPSSNKSIKASVTSINESTKEANVTSSDNLSQPVEELLMEGIDFPYSPPRTPNYCSCAFVHGLETPESPVSSSTDKICKNALVKEYDQIWMNDK